MSDGVLIGETHEGVEEEYLGAEAFSGVGVEVVGGLELYEGLDERLELALGHLLDRVQREHVRVGVEVHWVLQLRQKRLPP